MGPLKEARHAGGLVEVFRKRYLLWLLVRKEIKVRYQASALGLLWSYIQPIVRFCVYYFIAGLIIAHKTDNRALHIFSGMIMMQFFTTSMSAGAKAVVKNKTLIRKIYMPREMFPVASVAVTCYNVLPMYIVLIAGDFIYKWHPDVGALFSALLAFGIALIYGLGIAILLSAANVFVRDTTNVVEVINTVIRWTAPVIYTYSTIRPKLMDHPWINQVYISNPFNEAVMLNNRAFWITSFQSDTVPANYPNKNPIHYGIATELPTHLFQRGIVIFLIGFVFVGISSWFFQRVEGRFADKL